MKLSILHFQPLEMYPPVMNLLNTFDLKAKEHNLIITVFSTYRSKNTEPDFLLSNIKIKRTKGISQNENNVVRSSKYILFNCVALIHLIWNRPEIVFYYESFSAYPSIIYKKWINPKSKLIAHYHEYGTKEEFKAGSRIVRALWHIEKSNFGLFDMVSHTNQKRMELFKADYPEIEFKRTMILPNYPPKSWTQYNNLTLPKHPIRIVYLGALSLEAMYFKELCEWVVKQGNDVILDIYTSNISASATNYLKTHYDQNINLKGGINYFELPKILKDYHIGLILYKGVISNHIYSEPNKLFEYLACGLDVWLPKEIEGCKKFITANQYPKVMALDFNNFEQYSLDDLMAKNGLTKNSNTYYCEPIYEDYLAQINALNDK